MSFQDDLIEPDAIESAAHFSGLVRRTATNEKREEQAPPQAAPRVRIDPRRPLPRDLGN